MSRLCITLYSALMGGLLVSLITPTAQAERTGTLDMMAVNFPATGTGQINFGDGPQTLGETGLTVDTKSTTLSNGDELVEIWWSMMDRDNSSPLADDPDSPSLVSFALASDGPSLLAVSQFMVAMTIDGVPQTPGNPFGLPPLMNIGAHPHGQDLVGGRDFDVIILNNPPPPQYDAQDRLMFGLPSGFFNGQTFYNRGDVAPEDGGVPPSFDDAGGLDLFGYTALKGDINGVYNAWVVRTIPEPSSFILGMFGLAGLSFCRSQRTDRTRVRTTQLMK